jgi:hypothetical protein
MKVIRGGSLSKLLSLIEDRTVVQVRVTNGFGSAIEENKEITDPKGIDCIQTGKNSLLFLTTWDEVREESYTLSLKIPEYTKLSGRDMPIEAVTEANFTITGIFDLTTFTILCK